MRPGVDSPQTGSFWCPVLLVFSWLSHTLFSTSISLPRLPPILALRMQSLTYGVHVPGFSQAL